MAVSTRESVARVALRLIPAEHRTARWSDVAELGFAVIGFLAFKGNCCVRFAAILGPAMFQWGAAVGHIFDIIKTGNMAPGNAGIMLYSDILLPVIGFGLLWLKRRAGRASA